MNKILNKTMDQVYYCISISYWKKNLLQIGLVLGRNEAGNCRALKNWVLRSTSSLSTRITPRTRCAYLRVITCPTKYENMVALVAVRFHTLYVFLSVRLWNFFDKGQLMSECLFDVLNFPKKQRKNLINFCPRI